MSTDAVVNISAPSPTVQTPAGRVSRTQTKLHHWAAADPGRRFEDLYNLVYDPATLRVAWDRVAGNTGARTPGVDGRTVADIERDIGVPEFLNGVRDALKQRAWCPLPVRQRMIPKPSGSGKVRALGIPRVEDRVVQAALTLVLEPIFEADFLPVSYGFRPRRRAHDAIAEINLFGTKGYRWVLDADIEACFDSIDHTALLGRIRRRIKDKRVLALVKAFLKAGIFTESGQYQDTYTGTPQGGILSPLLANVALSVLDEHLHRPWLAGGEMQTETQRRRIRRHGRPTWRIIRYADDFVVLVHGNRADVEALREDVASVLEPLGLRLSAAKTRIAHMEDGFDFLGFHIQWCRKRGSNRWHVHTFIAERPINAVKDKIRALTRRTSNRYPRDVLIELNQIMRGWSNYFRYSVCKHVLRHLNHIVWWRVVHWLRRLHRWTWKDIRRRFTTPTGRWKPLSAGGIELFDLAAVPVLRPRYRGKQIPTPWTVPAPAQ